MNISINKSFILAVSLLSLNLLVGQEKQIYWIYTYTSELKDYHITGIETDQLLLNNGNWDAKISLEEIQLISTPPGASTLGQIIGGTIGGYGGMCVGFLAGVIIFPQSLGVREEGINGLRAIIISGIFGGVYYGKRIGGNLLKGKPEILADMTMWTVEEKREWIQYNLIGSY